MFDFTSVSLSGAEFSFIPPSDEYDGYVYQVEADIPFAEGRRQYSPAKGCRIHQRRHQSAE